MIMLIPVYEPDEKLINLLAPIRATDPLQQVVVVGHVRTADSHETHRLYPRARQDRIVWWSA